ncbi:hypothetical protein AVEN_181863-1 [Araneus ventricosus]|uniref:Uncharacterized protein n=1 Tax=Araneus ventricosus TaxID=182803 RepID=A0A4Y2NY21_ARAVE|nr:hypothetical protein AVEN_181863-1 [Araneus ventricosus]
MGLSTISQKSRQLNSIQRKFLLNITGAYSTTPTATLQVIEGITPLHIKAEQEAVYVRTARLSKTSNYNDIKFNSNNYEDGTTSTKFHPAIFRLEDRISLKEAIPSSTRSQYLHGRFKDRRQNRQSLLCHGRRHNKIRMDGSTSSLQHSLPSRASCYTGGLSLGKQDQPTDKGMVKQRVEPPFNCFN